MPEIKIEVGGRSYKVACQSGEEVHLQSAAGLLDTEAQTVISSAGNVPEGQLLLMSGLMLADKMAGDGDREKYADQQITELREKLRQAEEKAGNLSRELEAAALAAAQPAPQNGVDAEVLERTAEELERIADAMEAAHA